MEYCNLHNHSEYSLLDGMVSPKEMINFAKDHNQRAIAITDHGVMGGYYEMLKLGKKEGVKPLIGVEVYMVKDIDFQQNRSKGEKEQRYHLTLIAKNRNGLGNLFKLTSKAHMDGFYYKPRIDKEMLDNHKDDLIVMSGCIAGVIPQFILDGDYDLAKKQAKRFDKFYEDFHLEIQPNVMDDQVKVNKGLMKIHKETDIPLVATTDAHYLKEQQESHKVLLGINSGGQMWEFDDDTFHLMTGEEIFKLFKQNHPKLPEKEVKKAIKNSVKIADKCEIEYESYDKIVPPPYDFLDSKEEEFEYLKKLVDQGWKKKGMLDKKDKEEYQERLQYELKQIKELDFARYFLVVYDLYHNFVIPENIMYGTGRGSSASSLVCCLLDITTPDPIEHDLMFERFISPNRVTNPDIDMDFEDKRREEIKEYLYDKYGENKACDIGTYGTMKGKQVLRDVCRVFDKNESYDDIKTSEIDKVSNLIIQKNSGDARAHNTLEDTIKEFKEAQEFNEKHPEVLRHAKNLEGRKRQAGTHAAGVVVSPFDITDVMPLEIRGGQNGDVVTALEGDEIEELGFLKLDILGLNALSVVKDTIKQIELTEKDYKEYNIDREWPINKDKKKMDRQDLVKIDYNDSKVLQQFNEGKTQGVFQFNSTGMIDTLKNMDIDSFKDIISLNALYRPGSLNSGITEDFIERKNGNQSVEKIHPIYDKITEDTYGLLVYQEQVMQIFNKLANFPAKDVDKVRKKIAKSQGEEAMESLKDRFIEGCKENGLSKYKAQNLFEKIVHFGKYSFNKCVSGRTELNIRNKNGLDRQIKIEDLYNEFEEKTLPEDKIRIRSYKSNDGFRSLKRVYKTGVKEVYKLEMAFGNYIHATKDHKFLTDSGWKELGSLDMNDSIYVWDNNCNKNNYKLSVINSIERIGKETTYDLEVYSNSKIGHNYIANGIVTHNSHAVVYSQIAYWTQWLKTYYPLEFFVAALNNKDDDDKVKELLNELEKSGYELLLPHINKSNQGFKVEQWNGEKAIRCGLRYIKGIGQTTADEIVKHQPYKNEEDIINNDDIYKRVFHKGIRRLLREVDAWKNDDEYAQEEKEGLREFLAAEELYPFPVMSKNIEKAKELATHYDTTFVDIEDLDFSNNDFAYLRGVISGIDKKKIGDYGKPPSYSKWEMGQRYALVDLKDATGHIRIKFNPDQYQEYKNQLKIGQKILVHSRIKRDIKLLFLDFMITLSEEKIEKHKEEYGEAQDG